MTRGGRGRGGGPGRGKGGPAGAGGRAVGVGKHPPSSGDEQAPRLTAMLGQATLEVACGKCGIVKHPQVGLPGTYMEGEKLFSKCPLGGCQVCGKGGERGVCVGRVHYSRGTGLLWQDGK